MNICTLIPARNEAKKIFQTITSLQDAIKPNETLTILVYDDASSDKTAALAKQAGAHVFIGKKRSGKGDALNKLVPHIPKEAEIILLLDADLGTSAYEARRLIDEVQNRKTDLAIAKLPTQPSAGGRGFVVKLAKYALHSASKNGIHFEAPLSGQRAFSRKALDIFTPFAKGFGVEVIMTMQALNNNLYIREVPCDMYHTSTKNDLHGYLHRFEQYFDILRALRTYIIKNRK